MKLYNSTKLVFLTLTLLMPLMSSASNGEQIFNQKCASCHGSNNIVKLAPNLFGQEPAYLRASLQSFKSESRIDHIFSKQMNEIAKKLTDSEIEAVSTYLAGMDICEINQNINTEKDNFMVKFKAGKKLSSDSNCMHCHGSFHHMAPKLYGQKKEFFLKTLTAFKNVERVNPMMNRFTKDLTAENIENLSTYFNGMILMRHCD